MIGQQPRKLLATQVRHEWYRKTFSGLLFDSRCMLLFGRVVPKWLNASLAHLPPLKCS